MLSLENRKLSLAQMMESFIIWRANTHCGNISALKGCQGATGYPYLADNRRLKTVGLERWLAEQEERARRGVVYADIRYHVEQEE